MPCRYTRFRLINAASQGISKSRGIGLSRYGTRLMAWRFADSARADVMHVVSLKRMVTRRPQCHCWVRSKCFVSRNRHDKLGLQCDVLVCFCFFCFVWSIDLPFPDWGYMYPQTCPLCAFLVVVPA